MANNTLLPDIYNISDTVNTIQKKYNEDISEETLTMGIYGYLNETFSNSLQNSIIMAAEWGNEAFPIRSKFEKTILTNAITYGINDINAVPARMDVMIGFVEDELESNLVRESFTLGSDVKFMIEDYEYHIDYDMIITREKDIAGEYIYAARYDIGRLNTLSDVENPYLPSPIRLNISGNKLIFVSCTIRQVQDEEIQKKMITNNILDNKTIDFEFEDQLATFDVLVESGNTKTYLTPIFEGMPLQGEEFYCYYTFINNNTIRIKFDRNSYEPRINSLVNIFIKTTKGSECNFNYKSTDDIIISVESSRRDYKNLLGLIKPISSSNYGLDRKSINVLKQIIPREILSRGVITNNKDLENYFDEIENSKLLFYKKRDNQIERLYYSYLLVKDIDNNVVPTNTLDIIIDEDQFDIISDGRYILNPGNKIYYDKSQETAYIDYNKLPDTITDDTFVYGTPFICVVNDEPLSTSFYLNNIDKDFNFKFTYINQNSSLQFISNYLNCRRNYIDTQNYKISMTILQNMNIDKNLVEVDNDGNIISSLIKPILVITTENNYNYYVYGKIVYHDEETYSYNVEFELETDNTINSDNKIKLDNIYIGGSDVSSYIYVNDSVKVSVYLAVKLDNEYGREELDSIVPNLNGYTVCNKYTTIDNMELFYNYSNIMRSVVSIEENKDSVDKYRFKIKGLPMVRYSYLNNIQRCSNIVDYIQYRKAYIDNALKVLEDSFSIDFKFFNTYGPSRLFNIGLDDTKLNKVNLSLKFKVKLLVGADKKTIDNITLSVKNYIENINVINNIHMTNLTTEITNKYKSDIEFIEFLGINNYNALYQYLEKEESDELDGVPEFLNINLKDDLIPDISIALV